VARPLSRLAAKGLGHHQASESFTLGSRQPTPQAIGRWRQLRRRRLTIMSASRGPRSQASPSPAAIETIAASYVRNHVLFADCSPDSECDSMPAVPGAQAAADALIANLRVALQNPKPTAVPGSISSMTRHLAAAAAPSLIVGISESGAQSRRPLAAHQGQRHRCGFLRVPRCSRGAWRSCRPPDCHRDDQPSVR
jgi:hypothetical protein